MLNYRSEAREKWDINPFTDLPKIINNFFERDLFVI